MRSMIYERSYDVFMAPMELAWFDRWRREMLQGLKGHVLDIGAGTGANLRHYGPGVTSVTALDPRESALSFLELKGRELPFSKERPLLTRIGRGEDLPFPSGQFDVVVLTLVLCTVDDPEKVLSEGTRVLREGGELVIMEHQLPRSKPQALLFKAATPLWRLPFGCCLDRRTEDLVRWRKDLVEIKTSFKGPVLGHPFFIGSFMKIQS